MKTPVMVVLCRPGRPLMAKSSASIALGLTVAAVLFPLSAPAQTPACTYEACALRIKHRFFSQSIVQGAEEKKVATIGMIAPRLAIFAERSDSAHIYYRSFRSAHNTRLWLALGAAASLAGSLVASQNDEDGVAIALLAVGVGFTTGGAILSVKSRDHLSAAIWWYNRELIP